jgi:hypothetical protein
MLISNAFRFILCILQSGTPQRDLPVRNRNSAVLSVEQFYHSTNPDLVFDMRTLVNP